MLSFCALTYDKENNANNGTFGVQQWMYAPFAALKCDFSSGGRSGRAIERAGE